MTLRRLNLDEVHDLAGAFGVDPRMAEARRKWIVECVAYLGACPQCEGKNMHYPECPVPHLTE